jgi:hypothetical protein
VVEPVDPFRGGVLDGVEGAPRAAGFDHLGLRPAGSPLHLTAGFVERATTLGAPEVTRRREIHTEVKWEY